MLNTWQGHFLGWPTICSTVTQSSKCRRYLSFSLHQMNQSSKSKETNTHWKMEVRQLSDGLTFHASENTGLVTIHMETLSEEEIYFSGHRTEEHTHSVLLSEHLIVYMQNCLILSSVW